MGIPLGELCGDEAFLIPGTAIGEDGFLIPGEAEALRVFGLGGSEGRCVFFT